ncbi:MAG: PAS domain-containing protein [Salinibacter sp.]
MSNPPVQSSDVPSAVLVDAPEAVARVVAAVPSLLAMLDADGRVVACSEPWTRRFLPDGQDPPPIPLGGDANRDDGAAGPAGDLGAPLSLFDLFEDPDGAWRNRLTAVLDEQEPRRGGVHPLTQPTGATSWVEWAARPWQAPDGSVRGVLLSLTDRTEHHQVESIRRQVEQRFDTLVDTVSEGVLLMDSNGIFRDGNDAAQEILGRPLDQIVGTRFDDERWNGLRKDGTPLPNVEFPFWQAYVERAPVEGTIMGIYPPDAPPRWIHVNAQPLFQKGEDEPYAVLVCFEDITDKRLKEEALQTSRDVLSSVLSSSLDGIIVFTTVRSGAGDFEGFECLLANPQAEKLLNDTCDDLVGERLRDILPETEEADLPAACRSVVETGEPYEAEVHYATDALDAWFQVMVVSIEDGVALTLRDISDRKEAARAMAAANAKLERRNRALRDFAYIASHDLQEPLRKIRAFSNLVLEDYGDAVDDTGKHYLERMQDAAERMSQLINDLLVYSRITTRAQPFESVDLTKIAQNVRNDLDLQIDDVDGTVGVGDLPTIEADPTQMRQVLQNLIGNGLKFHKPDVPPRVTVQATVEPAPDDLKESGRLDAACTEMCRLKVADNGIGFEESHADRIFTPFKRLHGHGEYEGTGMGLAICQRIVERHGGDISATSAPNEGTTFTVLLPVARDRDGPTPDPSPEPAPDE